MNFLDLERQITEVVKKDTTKKDDEPINQNPDDIKDKIQSVFLNKTLQTENAKEKIIKVLDANRSKFYMYGEKDNKKKWLDTQESYELLKSFINDIHKECIHQGSVFNHLYKNHPEFEKVLNAYNMHDKVETFINKLLKEL